MSDLIARAPTASEVAAGELKLPLVYAGPDGAATILPESGADELGYHHNQHVPAVSWHVSHGLGRYPVLSVTATLPAAALIEVEGEVEHLNASQLVLHFAEPCEGIAWLR